MQSSILIARARCLLASGALALAPGLLSLGCSGGGSGGAPPPPAPPQTATALRTTRPADFTLAAGGLAGGGSLLTLRVGLEPDLRDPLFLGRVQPGRDVRLHLSVPRAATTFHYEAYDELGAVARGSQTIAPERAP